MNEPESIMVLGTPCILTDSVALTSRLEKVCSEDRDHALSVDFTNVHIVAMRTEDERFSQATRNVDWFVSDSQVLSWAISLLGGKNHKRVYGPEFLSHFVQNGSTDLTHYFFGASQDCLDALLVNLRRVQPHLNIVGSSNGYFSEDDEERILNDINLLQPDLVWVGLGTPKQQDWICRHKEKLRVGAILAVGFAFDVNAGTKKDAPGWLGPIGLTWLYRLICEPRRLWHRYSHYNLLFIKGLLGQLLAKH